MPTLLLIDSSPLGEASITRHLTHEFVQSWKQANPAGKVVTRDLFASKLPVLDGAWIGAAFTPEDARTPEQKALLALSDALIAELEAADELVFGVPMHNFSVPAILRLWIDQVVRAGKTFAYVNGTPTGLIKNKKATFLIAAGGAYDPGTAMASFNFVEPYLRSVFGFIGVTDTSFLTAGGAAAINFGAIDRPTFLQPHVEAIRSRFQNA